MNVRSINWLPLALVLSIAATSFWLQRKAEDGNEKPASRSGGVDFWAENFTVKRYGPDGNLQHVLAARRMVHESSDDSSVLDEPRLNFLLAPPLTITAKNGYVTKEGETVEFVGDVRLNRAGAAKNAGENGGSKSKPLYVRTERMMVFPDREQAQGNVPVRIEQPGSVATAASYRVDGKAGISILEGRVRATVQPNKP